MKIGEDGITLEEGWQSELGEELAEDKTLADIKDIPTMSKMLVHAQRKMGADKVALPGVDASEEEMTEFYTALGRPEGPDGYELPIPEEFPKEISPDAKLIEGYQKAAHSAGLTPTQAKRLFDWYNESSVATLETTKANAEAARGEAENTLREKYGDKYNETVKNALVAARTFLGDDGIEKLEKTGLGNAPWLVEAFAKVGEAIGEDKLSISHIQDNAITARAEIDRVMGDLNHPYHDKKAPGHVAAVHKVQDLFKMLYPEKK